MPALPSAIGDALSCDMASVKNSLVDLLMRPVSTFVRDALGRPVSHNADSFASMREARLMWNLRLVDSSICSALRLTTEHTKNTEYDFRLRW